MKLLQMQSDVFVCAQVAAVTREETTVSVHLVPGGSSFDYDFETESQAAKAVLSATESLLDAP